jgi:hypothetical protein
MGRGLIAYWTGVTCEDAPDEDEDEDEWQGGESPFCQPNVVKIINLKLGDKWATKNC